MRGELSAFVHLDAAYAQSPTDAERVGVELGRISLLTALGRYSEAILVFDRGVRILHHRVPVGATKLDVGMAILRLFRRALAQAHCHLGATPYDCGSRGGLGYRMCSASGLAVYYANENMKMIGAMLAARLTITHGNSRLSGFAYAAMIIITTQLSLYNWPSVLVSLHVKP